MILFVSGMYLMFFYHPAPPDAYFDMHSLSTAVAFGQFVRNVHRWSAHLMVLVVFLHLMRVFYAGAYRRPRQFNWVIGVVLLVLTLLMSFTGYLLPWDQLSYWAITVGTNIAGYVPVLGDQVRHAAARRQRGERRDAAALLRAAHLLHPGADGAGHRDPHLARAQGQLRRRRSASASRAAETAEAPKEVADVEA